MNICELNNYNQGRPDCDFELGVMDYMILAPSNVNISAIDQMRIFDYVREMSMNANPLLRYYPVSARIEQVEDTSTEATMGSLDKGLERKMIDGRFKYTLHYESFVCGDRNLQKLDGYRGGVFFINTKNLFIGARNNDGTMSPYDVTIYSDGGGFAASSGDIKTMNLLIDLGDKPKFIRQAMALKLRDTDRVSTLTGFRDLEISVKSVTAGVAKVQLVTGCDHVNVYDQYSTVFSTAANWRVNGDEPTTVTVDAPTKSFNVTVGSGTSELNVAPVDVLKLAGVVGFEGVATVVTSI